MHFSKKRFLPILLSIAMLLGYADLEAGVTPGSKFKLDEAVHTADAVVEAVVENISCIENKTGIHAIATLRLTKTFKGNENDSILQATYPGGFCNGDYAIVSHGISLHKGQDGLFFLHSDSSGSKSDTLLTDYHLSLVITYHHGASVVDHHIASYRGVAWDDLERDLLRPIEAITKRPRHILAPAPFEADTLHPIPLNGKCPPCGLVLVFPVLAFKFCLLSSPHSAVP